MRVTLVRTQIGGWICHVVNQNPLRARSGSNETRIVAEGHKKSELPRFKCFHNGIILIVNCFRWVKYNTN